MSDGTALTGDDAELGERARRLDAGDPLARWREEFVIADPSLAYLDGNSLGMPPRRTADRLRHVVEHEWAAELIGAWEHWVDLPLAVGDRLAPLLGATSGEVVVHDSVTVNLYQLVHAAISLRPGRSVLAVSPDDFPTDRYVVEQIASALGLSVRGDIDHVDEDVAVVVRSLVDYRTAEVSDLGACTAAATAAGALVIWDLSHAAGVLEVDLHAASVELAVGCTYKFLNGGPGAPAFSYVARHLVEHVDQPIHGWFGRADQFAMGPGYVPRDDIGRLLVGTPSILGLVAADAGIELTAEAGIAAIRRKATALTALALDCCDAFGLESPTPRDPARRGGHVSVRHPDAASIVRRLAAEHGVLADFREPDLVRLGCSPLTTRFVDVHRAVRAVGRIVA